MVKKLTLARLIETGLDQSTAAQMLQSVNQMLSSFSAAECWQQISQNLLTPDHPFDVHRLLHETVFSDWELACGPPPAWFPSEARIQAANINQLMKTLNLNAYDELHRWSVQHRADFWRVMIQRLGVQFKQAFTAVADLSDGAESPRWLVDAKLNIADSCFNAPDDMPAIVYQSEGGRLATMTYHQLHAMTNRVANGLVQMGFAAGDAIAVDMPMTAESVAIYLGIVKTGCIVVSIADSFAAEEIETRLRIAEARAIFTQEYIQRAGRKLPLYTKVVSANAPQAVVLPTQDDPDPSIQLRDGDVTWQQFLSTQDEFDSVVCQPHDHTNILFSSGTTGEPKAIPWTQTTPIKCAVDGHLHHDIQPGDVVAWPTNLGWMMGPWLIYASLMNQATIGLYNGAPTWRDFGEFVQNARVTMLGVVPSLVRGWRNTDCMRGLNWRAIKVFSSTGECSNPQDMLFLMSLAGYQPIIEYCGGTEIGGGYITCTVVQHAAPATFTTPSLGLDFSIFDENGQPANNGEVFLHPPSIGLSTELLNRDHHEVYFKDTPKPGLRRHGDQVERLNRGFYRIHGRVDDTMNLGGIKVGSAEIEEILNLVSGVRETAAIAISPEGGGPSELVIYTVLLPETDTPSDALKTSMQSAVGEHLNPLFRIRDVVVVESLPRTASNKVMRRVLRDRYRHNAS